MISDEQLIADYLKGDEQSLEVLIRRYLKPIYSFVYRYLDNVQEAEDITQEAFVRMWKNLKKFDQQKKFKTWLFSIAKNACIDTLRKKKEKREKILAETLVDPAPLPNKILERASITETIKAALEKLPPNYQLVLSLYYDGYFNFREIAESLGESLNTIKSRHRRALLALRKILTD